jgi:hypothetical protein
MASRTLHIRTRDHQTSHTPPPQDDPKAARERQEDTVSEPGGFDNDPDDPTNPNEAIERHRRKVRP